MKKRSLLFLTLVSSLVSSLAWARPPEVLPLKEALHDFLFSDFGAINWNSMQTHTMPSKVALTSFVLLGREKGWIEADSENYLAVLKRFGFQVPDSVRGDSTLNSSNFTKLPLGMVENPVNLLDIPGATITGLNVTCASCHGGHTYNSDGSPSKRTWPGLPNTSLNLEAYTQGLTKGLNLFMLDQDRSHKLMEKMFPELHFMEKFWLSTAVYPIVKGRLAEIDAAGGSALPFSNGSPGLTNGVAAIKFTLGVGNSPHREDESGFTSTPPLGDRFFRSSLLYDGSYAPPFAGERFREKTGWTEQEAFDLSGVVALFTIPTMGQERNKSVQNMTRVYKAMTPVIENYKAPPFPGPLDPDLAKRGSKIYSQNCAGCHGTYNTSGLIPRLEMYPNRLVPQDVMNTDPKRWQAVTPNLIAELSKGETARLLKAENTGGYVAPLLNSLWATAPYLHNGSVPTLWAFMNPAIRPAKFLVGGHHMDFNQVGILLQESSTGEFVYPAHVIPDSDPAMYDTTEVGRSNQGHTSPFEKLSQEEKLALLEFLKLL